MSETFGGVLWLLAILIVSTIAWVLYATRRRRPDDGGYEFVYVDVSGGAREVTVDGKLPRRIAIAPARQD